jgi:hypothetical protein
MTAAFISSLRCAKNCEERQYRSRSYVLHPGASAGHDFIESRSTGCAIRLGRTITFQDIPVKPWRDELLARRLPVHLRNHVATMADLHRAGRYDRMSDEVFPLTGKGPLTMQEFVRKNAATFTASAKAA